MLIHINKKKLHMSILFCTFVVEKIKQVKTTPKTRKGTRTMNYNYNTHTAKAYHYATGTMITLADHVTLPEAIKAIDDSVAEDLEYGEVGEYDYYLDGVCLTY